MCGIAGFFKHETVNGDAMQLMLQAIQHRGPNDRGSWTNGNMHLGMTRLSIIDLTTAGHQPMFSNDNRYVIVFNGEVYNFKEKQQELLADGFSFHSQTDTEVVLYLFIKYGKKCLEHMRGMFAFAIWDNHTEELFIARDHMGIKPLLYHFEDGQLTFCSEMKGILASGLVPRKLSKQGISLYLQKGFIAPPFTAIENVHNLNPGHYLTFSKSKGIQTECYWDIDQKPHQPISYEDAVQKVRHMVLDAVKEELMSDVPLGVFLSGGLDSSVMVAAMKNLGNKNISTFSIGFKSNKLDETTDAEESAQFFGSNHHNVMIDSHDVASNFDHFIIGLDQPSVDGLNTFLVSKATKQKVSVALSGLGGDELFAGYAWQHRYYKSSSTDLAIGQMLTPVTRQIDQTGKFGRKLKNRYISYTDAHTYYANIHLLFPQGMLNNKKWFAFETDHTSLTQSIAQYPIPNHLSRLQQVNKMDMRYFMGAELLRDSDAVSMSHSLEVRFPLIDIRLVDFVYNLPDDYKIHHNLTVGELNKGYEQQLSYKDGGIKKLLFDAFKDDLPPSFSLRSKRGFKMPYELWMKEEPLITSIIESLLRLENAITSKGSTANLLNAWKAKKITWQQVWALFVLERWITQNHVEV